MNLKKENEFYYSPEGNGNPALFARIEMDSRNYN
jgi:hypothetical protein